MRDTRPPEKGQGDMFIRLTLIQVALCVVLVLLVFAAMHTDSGVFGRLSEEFHALTEEDHDPGSFRLFDFGSAKEKQESAETQNPTVAASAAAAGKGTRVPMPMFYETEGAVMPVNGTLTSAFGERVHPVSGEESFHGGEDIAAPEGTPVYAALDGEVAAAGVGEMSGNYVRLSHGGGVETLYCHLSAVNVTPGVAVRRGDVIGFVGETGLATGPHLHFELHINGEKTDPAPLLEGAAVVS